MDSAPHTPPSAVHPHEERGRQLNRVNAFSDGLFTIAATLLVLSIKVPDVPQSRARADLPHEIGSIFSGQIPTYFLSFAVIGILWLRHHELFGRLTRSDSRFAALNLAFLAFIAVLPFPTELLGRYGDVPLVVALYAANLLVLSVLLRTLAWDAERRDLLSPDHTAVTPLARVRGRVATALFAISIPVAWLDPHVAIASWFGAFILPRLIVRGMEG